MDRRSVATDQAISIEFKRWALDAERILAMAAESKIPGGAAYFGELRDFAVASGANRPL